jgi:glycosyltransferase involved in cell wall biosynthesis
LIPHSKQAGVPTSAVRDVDAPPIRHDGPLVSCLMVSRGKLFPARHAIDCFRAQTYGQRELVIVDDNPESELAGYLDTLDDSLIRHVRLPPGQHRLGGLRNLSLAEAKGELVCQWDDDDLCDRDRLGRQVAALQAEQADACFFRRQTLWWPAAQRLAITCDRIWENSMLARRAIVPEYPEQPRGEDTVVTERIVATGRIVMLDAPELYCYVIHGGNTFHDHHFLQIYNAGSDFSGRDGYAARLASLAQRFPVVAYAEDLRFGNTRLVAPDADPEYPPDRLIDPAQARNGRAPSCAEPLVSIIVRSMGRPSLCDALHSLAQQEYRYLDIVVVDATGGRHPPLPEPIAGDPRFRLVGAGTPLKRAAAANYGLGHARGEYIGFLDDDDLFDPAHVALLVERILRPDHPDLVYTGLWILDRHHRITRRLFHPFNPLVMYYFGIISAISAIFHRHAIESGCRFDESLDIAEDWDFWLQVLPHVQIRSVDANTQYYFIEAGTSGTGIGLNKDLQRSLEFVNLVHTRWAPCRDALWEDYLRCFQNPQAALHDGDILTARRQLRALLSRYPDEPNANFALGRTYAASGQLLSARYLYERAIAMNTSAVPFMLAHAALCEALGDSEDALHGYRRAASVRPEPTPVIREAIRRLEEQLSRRQPRGAPEQAPNAPGRNDPCPCGSGKRFKRCCGATGAGTGQRGVSDSRAAVVDSTPAARAQWEVLQGRGAALFREGELLEARRQFAAAEQAMPGQAATHHALALLAFDLGEMPEAVRRISMAHAAARGDEEVTADHQRIRLCDRRMTESARMKESIRAGKLLLDAAAILSQMQGARAVMVLEGGARIPLSAKDFAGWGGTLTFSPHSADAQPEGWPESGGILIIDGLPELIPALFDRRVPTLVLIRVVRDAPAALLELLDAAAGMSRRSVGLVYPDATTAALIGLPGIVVPRAIATEPIVRSRRPVPTFRVGLRGADTQYGAHPLDPPLIRACLAQGCAVDVAGGTALCRYFPPSTRPPSLRLLTHRADSAAFLATADCLVLRRAPAASLDDVQHYVVEAMAAGLALICAPDMPGADLIENGVTGIIVDPADNLAILDRIAWLRDTPDAARAIGARATARARDFAQRGHWSHLLAGGSVQCVA